MRFFVLIWVIALCFSVLSHARSRSNTEFHLLPGKRPFRLPMADPQEIRMAVLTSSGSRIQALVGNYFSLIALSDENAPEFGKIHIGLEGVGIFSLRQADSRFPLEHTDGLMGLYIEGDFRKRWQWQFRYTHISSHLSDGIEGRSPIAYSREYLGMRMGYQPQPRLNVYAGAKYYVNSVPVLEPFQAQLGASYILPSKRSVLTPFLAADLQWKAESQYNPSLSTQIGLALNNPLDAYESFRLFYAYFTGADPRGQFHTQVLTQHSFGIEMQI